MRHVLTFDLGTTYFKAAVFDGTGRLVALARTPTPVASPQPGWRQIDPGTFFDTLTTLAAQLRRQQPQAWATIAAVSFATQTNSLLLLDERDQPLTPIILWNDRRAESCAGSLQRIAADATCRARTGIPAVNTQFAIAKLIWLREHQPDVWRQARRLHLIGDHLAWWLTGQHVTEAGAAGLTGLLDIHTLAWRQPLLRALDAGRLELPSPRYAGIDLGALHPRSASALQLPDACHAVLGCLDQHAGAIGAGNVTPGHVSETTGTVLATVALVDQFDAELPPGVFQGPAWRPGLWWRMRFGSVSANLLDALRRNEPDNPGYPTLDAEAAAADCGGLQLDAAASADADRPIFRNLQPHHTRGHRVRAILRAVAVALRDQVSDLIGDASPATPVRSMGGAARSRLWLAMKAQTLGREVLVLDCPEPASLGAVILALVAVSAHPDLAGFALTIQHNIAIETITIR